MCVFRFYLKFKKNNFYTWTTVSNYLLITTNTWYRPLEIILAKKITELVLLFYKKTTKLVFLWPNKGQKCFKVLIKQKNLKNVYKLNSSNLENDFNPLIFKKIMF